MMAAKKGNVGIVRKLIHHGANVKLTNKVNPPSFQIICIEFGRKITDSNRPGDYMSAKLVIFTSSRVHIGVALIFLLL